MILSATSKEEKERLLLIGTKLFERLVLELLEE